ncbi:hypothetical protein FOCC_FOCC011142 [Frankliniella occidentalis]|nr:hypothetical protein FOCC_FOCC011142 [Frankliniella occidentalis]
MGDFCAICGRDFSGGDKVTCASKGIASLLKYSVQRGDKLHEKLKNVTSLNLHSKCRKDYTRRIKPDENVFVNASPSRPPLLRSTTRRLLFVREGSPADEARSEPMLSPTPPFLSPPASFLSPPGGFKTPAKPTAKRPATSPAEGTPSRIPVPKFAHGRGRGRPGRPLDEKKMSAFDALCEKLESADEPQFTMSDLAAMMPSTGMDTETYSEKHLARLLKDKYNKRVIVVERPGKSSILCFLGKHFDAVGEAWYANRAKSEQDERRRIVEKAAEIIYSDISAMWQDPEQFPAVDGSGPAFVPASLTALLQGVTLPRKKGQGIQRTVRICEVLGHSIISASRPRSFISPIMLELGVWVHRKIGSRTLCDILHNMGSSVPYSLIQEYEKSAVLHSTLEFDADSYIQFAFDNFDFNSATIDGHGTTHSMGGMIYVTPKTGVPPQGSLPRLTPEMRKIPQSQFGVIPLEPYSKPHRTGLSSITVIDQRPAAGAISTREAASLSRARQFDLLWLVGNTAMPRIIPGWNGFMSSTMEGTSSYALTATLPLPFVNLNPSDPSTISTCLHFAAEQARIHHQKFCPVTFDQPLFWKAAEMVSASPQNSPLRKVIVRLGGFHLLMSFMGSVGNVMSGSGVEDLWATVYAKNTVQHISSGKAYSRAVRAHFLTQTALLGIVFQQHKLENNQFYPVTTNSPPAPKELLELISCNCRGSCSSACGCVRAGLKCTSFCGHCAGVGCLNAEAPRDSDDEDDGEDEGEDNEADPDDPPSFAL